MVFKTEDSSQAAADLIAFSYSGLGYGELCVMDICQDYKLLWTFILMYHLIPSFFIGPGF